MEQESAKFGLHVSWAKTKVQNLGWGPDADDVLTGDHKVEGVTAFTYLGSKFASKCNSFPECMRRIGLTATAMDSCNGIWCQRSLSLSTKIRLYSTYIMPILLYGAEIWAMTAAEWAKLQAFHMRNQRRILQIKWNDFVTNEEVARTTELLDIRTTVRQPRIRLFGHVARLPSTVPASSILSVSCSARDGYPPGPDWQRPRGRPPTTWVHHICADADLSALDTLHLAQDRSAWRAVVTASGLCEQ